MSPNNNQPVAPPSAASILAVRQKAEAIVRQQESEEAKYPQQLSPVDTQQMLHELRVHQIELEMQNEELRRAQLELEASRLRYFDLYDLAPVGYLSLSVDGLIQQANFTAAALLGVGRKSLVGQSITRFVLSEDQDIMYLCRRQLLTSREPQTFELRMIRGGGSSFWAHLECTAALDPDSAPTHRLVLSDITGRKQAEQEKVQLEAQLRQAQKLEAVGRLAGGVAHDFNNMLAVVITDTELALTQVQPGQQLHADLTEILKAARRSAELTNQLLTFARKQTIAPKVLDLNEAMAGMIKLLQRLLGEDVRLTWQPEGSLWPVLMDSSQLDQLLANLCINARDAITSVGTVSIRAANSVIDAPFCLQHTDAVPGEYVRLSITDTGCGMDLETLAHIFEPFFTTKPVGEGTGLGLSSVYGAVRQNHGFVTVTSELGSGTTFSVYLPRHLGRAEPVEVKPTPSPRLKTLFMSGYTADVMIERGAIDNQVHFIQKPFAIASMSAAVRLALDS